MEPVTAGILAAQVAVPVINGLINNYQARKAAGASEAELRRMEDEFNRLKPVNYPYEISDPPQLHYQALQDPRYAAALEQTAQYIQEKQPELIKDTEQMKFGREAQNNALRRYLEVSESKEDPQYREALERASQRSSADAQSRQASLMDAYKRRGIGGSGFELQAQLGSQAAENQRQGMENLSAASQAYKNRLEALASGAELGGRIQNQDLNQQQINMNAINSFNQRAANNRQNYEWNRQNFILGERNRQDDQAREAYNRAYNERGYRQGLDDTNYQRRRQYEHDLKDRADTQYGQNLDIMRMKAGLASNRADRITRNAQDEMARRTGMFDAAGAGLREGQSYMRNSQYDRQEDLDRRRRRHIEDQYYRERGYTPFVQQGDQS